MLYTRQHNILQGVPRVSVNKQDRQVYISRVKPVEPRKGAGMVGVGVTVGGASYRRAKSWSLGEVKVVDGRNSTTEVTEFDLHINKTVYKWVASNVAEKKSFISCIFKVCTLEDVKLSDSACSELTLQQEQLYMRHVDCCVLVCSWCPSQWRESSRNS